ncbi:MAG: hypothetical protein QM621_01450 [Aeromicrobium sp.]|uniref:hypothetical protein n=1 Tax=Aeromicrobium sp. TaxID=1871063 RepID=UPI0039E37443
MIIVNASWRAVWEGRERRRTVVAAGLLAAGGSVAYPLRLWGPNAPLIAAISLVIALVVVSVPLALTVVRKQIVLAPGRLTVRGVFRSRTMMLTPHVASAWLIAHVGGDFGEDRFQGQRTLALLDLRTGRRLRLSWFALPPAELPGFADQLARELRRSHHPTFDARPSHLPRELLPMLWFHERHTALVIALGVTALMVLPFVAVVIAALVMA